MKRRNPSSLLFLLMTRTAMNAIMVEERIRDEQ